MFFSAVIYTDRFFGSSRKWHFPTQTPRGTAEGTNAGATRDLTTHERIAWGFLRPRGGAGTTASLGVTAFVPSSFCWCPELPRQTVTDTSGGGCLPPRLDVWAGDGGDAARGQRGEGLLDGGEGDFTGGGTGGGRAQGCEGESSKEAGSRAGRGRSRGAAREEPQAAQQVERGDKRANHLKPRAKNRNLSKECV